ncbi:hypothetical protein [Psychrobacter sp. 219-2-C]|uniref:hypothetical protein n=1 Tax=Psychrobacter sp. 219-2-C TaxID=3414707 RepID=UPI003C6E3A13
MSILDEYVFERMDYIPAIGLINLIADNKDDYIDNIASYLVLNNFDKQVSSYLIDKHGRVTQVERSQENGCDTNTSCFLDRCHSEIILSKSVSNKLIDTLKGYFYYSCKELESIDCIKKLGLKLNFLEVSRVNDKVKQYDENEINLIYRNTVDNFHNPNAYQLNYFRLKKLDIKVAACLLAGIDDQMIDKYQSDLRFSEIFKDYISYKLMLEAAIKNNDVSFKEGFFTSDDLQKYLFDIGYVLKGFNDWLRIQPAKPLIDVKHDKCQSFDVNNEELVRLTQKAADDQATIDKITIEKDEIQSELIEVKAQLEKTLQLQAIDDLKDVPHQSYRTVDRIMYAMAKLSKLDNTEPYSQNNPSLNASITTILQNDGLTLEYQAVGKWLTRINNVKSLTNNPIITPEKLKATEDLKSNI